MTLVLASASAIRRSMLESAGVAVTVDPAEVDEAMVKAGHDGSDPQLAAALAEAKARERSCRLSGKWVIGGDSVVSVNGRRFDKPRDREEAAAHLRAFSGQTMALTSAVALARNAALDWIHAETAQLHLRHFDDEFIHNYLDAEWPQVSYCVGVFRMEGRGVQLFDHIEGDHFTILGMPLLPLLDALRSRHLIPS